MRHLPSLLALTGVVAVSACASDEIDTPQPAQSAAIANRNLDVLFMIDNSSSMRLSQSNLRALGADGRGAAPAENQGFLRQDALLAIVMVTNEDDCSARAGIQLYDTSSNQSVNSVLGPPSNFRCNEFGHLCNGARPPRM